MTEQEKLDYYELHGSRPPQVYIIYRLDYATGNVVNFEKREFRTANCAREFCQGLAETSEDTGKYILLFIDRRKASDETISEDFEEFIQMFWPEAVKEAMQTFFEVL